MTNIEQRSAGERIGFGRFALFPGARLLTRDGEPVEIGGRSLDLLIALAEQPGRVLSKRELLKRVWSDVVVEDGSLRFHMAGLRRLLGDGRDGARYIATQVGVGYAFVATVERDAAPDPPSLGATPAHSPSATNLPPRQPDLIGRERDIPLLKERIARTQLFTILGPGGVGKTSLAIEMGHILAESFAGQVAFVDFSMLENPALVPGMIAGAMGLAVQGDDPLAVMLGHMRAAPFLLLLDNCEHLIEPVALLVERLVEAAPHVRVLTTSREPLRVRGEHIHRLDALACPEDDAGLTLTELLAFPAVQLFHDRARAADSGLEIDLDAARLIAAICRQLDGIALAIELAAVRVASHGLHATARQLDERFGLGWVGRRTAQPRQQTLQAMLDWSYDLLSGIERIVLERLSVFVGPFSVDSALAVVADADLDSDAVVAALDELVLKSLVSPGRSRGAGSYRLLEITRAYAKRKLRSHGDAVFHAMAQRHAAYFLAELEAAAAQDEDVWQDPRPLRQQLGNIRCALDWSFGFRGGNPASLRLAAASAPVFLSLSHFAECQIWCARALDAMEEGQHGTALEMELQGALGLTLMFSRGSTPAAETALSRALAVATSLDDPWGQLRMLGRLHIFHERIGACAIAQVHASRALDIARDIGNAEALGVARSLTGISHYLAGDQRRALEDLERALADCPMFSRSRMIRYGFDHRVRTTIALARTLWLSGQAERATALTRQAIELAVRLDQPVTHCIALIWSLALHIWKEDFDAAQEAMAAFAECARVNALGPYVSAAIAFRADLAIRQGTEEGSPEEIEHSLIRLREVRYELLTTHFSLALARGLLRDQRLHEAAEAIDGAITRCLSIGEGFAMSELLAVKADIAHAAGKPEDSITLLEQALDVSRKQGARAWTLKVVWKLAAQLVEQDRPEDAIHRLEQALEEMSGSEFPPELRRVRNLLAELTSER
ncbi:winged helix-turn-helix domain-containing protein [Sphingobium sp.]|uniref:winged helix-turn-helix domain-containing protein n=1 Tax=Sphingobium sp. TaxID=1912891 RepID=UPI0035C729F7